MDKKCLKNNLEGSHLIKFQTSCFYYEFLYGSFPMVSNTSVSTLAARFGVAG